ncbi:MAG: hypothetical protein OEZ65_07010 [Gemmatimonadota bacterium]|nr:hypothetical protein [Gemmatimonadota bacterium]MDH5759322.1 hypothetical protein [Gemmatimonadota bacterium]
MSPAPGYETLRGPYGSAIALPEAAGRVHELLEAHPMLRDWARAGARRALPSGRGDSYLVSNPIPPGDGPAWVVRPMRRGGAVAHVLGDRYARRGVPRPFLEARASAEARRRGIATPRVVAAAVYPSLLFYRCDVVTEFVEGGIELAAILPGSGDARGVSAPDALRAAGRLVTRLAEAGIEHADLNARNLLLVRDGDDLETVVLDLDGCRIAPPSSARSGSAMRRRLERSLRKLEARSGTRLPPSAWKAWEAEGSASS